MLYFFSYGSLVDGALLQRAGCKPLFSEPATLPDYQLMHEAVVQEPPAFHLNEKESDEIHGVLYLVKDASLAIIRKLLDNGKTYELHQRTVVTYKGRNKVALICFRAAGERLVHGVTPLLAESWAKTAINSGILPSYVKRQSGFSPTQLTNLDVQHTSDLRECFGPAAQVIAANETINAAFENENRGFLSFRHGLMPQRPPISALPSSHQVWDQTMHQLPSLYREQRLREVLESLPLIDATDVNLPDHYLLRACSVLAMLSHAYWYVEPLPPQELPEALAKPWRTIRGRLGRGPEVLNYIDLIVYNWRLLNSDDPDPLRVENMRLMTPTVDNQEEHVFYLTQAEILGRTSPAVGAMAHAQEAVIQDDPEALQGHLLTIYNALSDVVFSSLLKINPNPRSHTYVDPVVWAKTVAPFAVPFHEGVQGPSGTSSPIFNALDIFFGRKDYQSFLGREIKELRDTYPIAWRDYLVALTKVSIPDYVKKKGNSALSSAFRDLFQLYAGDNGFLGRHRLKVYSYLEIAFKVGRNVTIGGFGGAFKDRTWDEVDNELEASRGERLIRYPLETLPGTISDITPGADDPNAEVQHVTINVESSGLYYEPGDRCSILPTHRPELIEKTLSALGLSGNEQIKLTAEWTKALSMRNMQGQAPTISSREILKFGSIRPVAPRLAEALHALTQNEMLKEHVRGQTSDHWELWELLEALKNGGFMPTSLWQDSDMPSDKLARLIPPEHFRSYSISSVMQSASLRPAKEIELTVAQIRYDSRHSGAACRGTASTFLASYAEDRELCFFVERPPRFQLPSDPRTPVIMLAGGSGISPFRSFLAAPFWRRTNQAWLFLGLRTRRNFHYENDFLPGLQQGTLKIDVAFSRDDVTLNYIPEQGLKLKPGQRQRINDRLLSPENAQDLWKALRSKEDGGQGAHVYICGRSSFGATVIDTLKTLFEQFHQDAPQPSRAAEETLYRLVADGRLKQELYSDSKEAPESPEFFDISEVALHNNQQAGYWMIIADSVYDLSQFIQEHPGGARILKGYAGMDASEGFARAHQGRSEISAMQESYLIGTVRQLEFGCEEAIAQGVGGPRRVSTRTVYDAWTRALMLVVEMQNALLMDQGLQTTTVISDDHPATPSHYKLSRSIESHQRFLRNYLDLLMNETLRRLWTVTQSLFAPDKEPQWAKAQILEIVNSEEAIWLEAFSEDLFAYASNEKYNEAQIRVVAEVLQLENSRLLKELKMILLIGVSAFERCEKQVIKEGAEALQHASRSSIDVIAGYFSRVVQELHEKRGLNLSDSQSITPRKMISVAPPHRVVTSNYWYLEEYGNRRLCILRRTPAAVTTLEDLSAENRLVLERLAQRYQNYGLVVDYRQAPTRNDPDFEETMTQFRIGLTDGFSRTSVLIGSAIGVLQVNRLGRMDARHTLATQSESTAIKFALGDR